MHEDLVLNALFSLCLLAAPPEPEVVSDTPPVGKPDRRTVVDAKRIERLKRSFFQRTLWSHPFVQPQFIASALPTTHMGFGLGLARVRVDGSDPETGAARRSTYRAGFGALDGGVRITKWFGLAARLDGVAGVGGTPNAALDYGAAAGFGWSTRALVRLVQGKSTALSIGPNVFGSDARALLLQPGFEYVVGRINDFIDDGVQIEDFGIEPGELQNVADQSVRRSRSIGAGVQVGLAQAFGRFVGLQVGLEGGGQRQRLQYNDGQAHDDRSRAGYLRTGAALSFDAGVVPLAAMVEYNANMSFGSVGGDDGFRVAHQTGVGLFLNGLTHTIGLLGAAELAGNQITLGAHVNFRAYF